MLFKDDIMIFCDTENYRCQSNSSFEKYFEAI